MGIDGLLTFLKPVTKVGHISNFSNKTAAIDVMVWLYRGAYSCALELATKQPTNNYLLFVYKMLQLLKKWNIKPIICIDGRDLIAKERTNQFRSQRKKTEKEKGMELFNKGSVDEAKKAFTRCINITKKMIYKLVDMLRAMNIEYIIAPYESDAQISYLCKNGLADIAISEDSDLLCYNCPVVLYKLSSFGECEYVEIGELRAKRKNKEKLPNSTLDTLFSLSEENFTHICILAGCDYLPSVKGMGLKKAISFFERFGNIDSVIRRMRIEHNFMGKVPEEYEKTVHKVALIFLYQLVYDPTNEKLTTLHPRDDFDDFVSKNKFFIGELIPDIKNFISGKLNIKTFEERQFEEFDLQALIGNKKSLEVLAEQGPTTQDIIRRTMTEIKNERKFAQTQQTQNANNDNNKRTPNRITVTQPEEKREPSPNFVDLDDFHYQSFEYDFDDFAEEQKDTVETAPKRDPTRHMKFDKKQEKITDQIDFLFMICKEYSRGLDDSNHSSERPKEAIPKSPQKPMITNKKSPLPSKPNSTFKTYLDMDMENEAAVVTSPRSMVKVMEQEEDMIDSFRKLKAMDGSVKKSPIIGEKENKKMPSNVSTPINITPAKKEEPKSSAKRKAIEFEKNKDVSKNGEGTMEPEKNSTKKTKTTPSAEKNNNPNQPKISIFFQKNK